MPNKSPNGKPPGLTLIEVVVALAIAGSLLVATILSATRHEKQLRLADDKQLACDAVDRFLTQWSRFEFSDDQAAESAKAASVSWGAPQAPSTKRQFWLTARLQPGRIEVSPGSNMSEKAIPIEVVRVQAVTNRMAGNTSKELVLAWVEIARPKRGPQP